MIKKWILFLLFALSILLISYSILGRPGLLVGLALSFVLLFIVLSLSESQLLLKQRARPLRGQDAWGLRRQLIQLCQHFNCPKPDIYLKEEPAPLAYALKAGRETGVILLSTGLLKRMNHQEMRVILAYQILSLLERRSIFNHLWTTLLHSGLMLGYYLDRLFFAGANQSSRHLFFSRLAKSLADFVARLAPYSRRHLARDEKVAEAIGQSELVAHTLWKLDNLMENLHSSKPFCGEHLLIVNPLTARRKSTYFLSHPSLEKRIRQLVGQYPL